MVAKGDSVYAWAAAACQERGECGSGNRSADARAQDRYGRCCPCSQEGQDVYDAVPVLITDPAEIAETAGSLHCGTLLLSKIFKNYLDGAENMKIAVTVKGCDAMGYTACRSADQPGQRPDDRPQLWWHGKPRDRQEDDPRKFEVDPDDVVRRDR